MPEELTFEDAKKIFIEEEGDFFDIISLERKGKEYFFKLKRKRDGIFTSAVISDDFRHAIIAPG